MQQTPSSFGQRIRAIRRHAGLSQREFGKKIGLSGNRVSEIEHEKGGMSAGVLFSINREFLIDSEWLMTGEGRMISAVPPQPETTTIEARLYRIETEIEKISQEEHLRASPIATIPLYLEAVAAGYPNPVRGDIEEQIDIPASWTHGKKQLFALRVSGESMTGIGIMPGDTLVVEAKYMARDRQVVIASIDGEMTVKTLSIEKGGAISLLPENPAYQPIPVTSDMDFRIHGIVIAALRSY